MSLKWRFRTILMQKKLKKVIQSPKIASFFSSIMQRSVLFLQGSSKKLDSLTFQMLLYKAKGGRLWRSKHTFTKSLQELCTTVSYKDGVLLSGISGTTIVSRTQAYANDY